MQKKLSFPSGIFRSESFRGGFRQKRLKQVLLAASAARFFK